MTRQTTATLGLGLLLACGGTTAREALNADAASSGARQPAPPAAVAPRSFARGATFDTLIVRTQALLLAPTQASAAGECVLRAEGERTWLEAELMASVDPLPLAPTGLVERLARSVRPVRVLTAWGEASVPEQSDIALAAFTALDASSRRLPHAVLFVTSRGAYLRHGQRFADAEDGPLDASALQARLDAMSRREPYVLYVTADAGVLLSELHATLALLADSQPTALAVALPEGTTLPAPQAPPEATRLLCPQGLPEPAADAVEGELSPERIREALDPLREAAQRCLEQASGQAAAGGRLVLAMRVGAEGAPQALCLVEDGIGDGVLSSCVVESARTLRLPRPEPAGFVDVHLPLQLSPISRPPPHPVCR